MTRHRRRTIPVVLLILTLGAGCGTISGSAAVSSDTVQPSAEPDAGPGGGDEGQSQRSTFEGRIIADEYEWFLSPVFLGVTEITGDPLQTARIVNGSQAQRLPDGRITFRQPCGARVHQIAIADTNLRTAPITPCSGTIENSGSSPTDFGFSALSPDGRFIAVEATHYLDGGVRVAILVFDVDTQEHMATLNGAAPAWLPDGRLMVATSDWFWTAEVGTWTLERFPGDMTGAVNNPAVSPNGEWIAFEHNQQIWGMDIDGSDVRVLVIGNRELRYPAWSPDGRPVLVYLATPKDDQYEPALHFTDLDRSETWSVNVKDHLSELGTLNGPLTWSS